MTTQTALLRLAATLFAFFTSSAVLAADIPSKAELGQLLFFDTNLSYNRSQSCASCHAPAVAFVDPRGRSLASGASLGADGLSLSFRNAPSTSYASLIPVFQRDKDGYLGGQFWDGRAPDLASQAGGPPLNPREMAMPNKASIAARLRANANYADAFKQHFGAAVLTDEQRLYTAMTHSIAAFERSEWFAPFDSKYDRYLRGEYQMTRQQELGRTLFFSQQFSNCNGCHQLRSRPGAEQETFSDYRYYNIGTPRNPASVSTLTDRGLLDNPVVNDPAQAGKFKVPTLRNVAVTAPYMHNGVFQELRTVLLFYNQYNSRSAARKVNPETGQPWRPPEVDANLAIEKLTVGPALKNRRIDALLAFLKLLTDRRYEHLLVNQD